MSAPSQTSYSASNGNVTMTAEWQSGSTWLIRYTNPDVSNSSNDGNILLRVGGQQSSHNADDNAGIDYAEKTFTATSAALLVEGQSEDDGFYLSNITVNGSNYVSINITDTGYALQAGDMVGLVMSVDHQDRNSDEDTEDWTQAAFFVNFDTFDFSASNNGNTATQSAINLDTASHPTAYWSFNREDAWYGVGDNHESIYSGSLGSGFEHTATMGGVTYKIRYRLIEKNNIPAGLSTDFSGYSSSTVYGIINGSTSDSFHDFTQGGSPDTYLKTWTNTSNISSGGTNNTRAYNWIEAYVYEVVGGGGASASGAVDVTVRGMDASHNTLATDTEATTFDSSKYYRVNVNAIGVDHWGWNIDGGSETMMPAGSTYFVINGADYQGTGGSSTIAVGDVIGLMAYGTEVQTSSQDSDEDDFRYVVLNGIFDSVNLPLDPGSSPGWNERTGKTMQALINDKNVWTPGDTRNKQPLDGIIASLAATSTGDVWHVGDINEGQTTSFFQSGHIAGGTTHAGVGLRFLATTGNTTYTLGITSAAVSSGPTGANAMPYLKNGGSNSFWSPYSVSRNIDYYHIHEIEVISIATTSSTFDTSNRSLWGGTNYPKFDIFYAHGHGGTYNGYGTGYTKTFINWTQDYGFGFGNPRGDSWMWTHTGHTGPVYGYRKIKGRWLGDARGLGDDDGTPVYPGYNFGFWAQPHVSPPADGIYPDGSTRPHSANISSSSHANITYGYDLSNNGNPAPVTDSNGVMTWERAMMGPISDVMEYDVTLSSQNLAGQSSSSTFRGITFDENVGFGLRSTSWDEGSDGESQSTMFRGAAFLVVGFQDDAGVWHYKDEYL